MLDRPIQAAAEGLLKKRSSNDLRIISDELDAIAYLNDAMFMSAGSVEEPRHCNALQALSMQINKDLTSLRDRVEALMEAMQ